MIKLILFCNCLKFETIINFSADFATNSASLFLEVFQDILVLSVVNFSFCSISMISFSNFAKVPYQMTQAILNTRP